MELASIAADPTIELVEGTVARGPSSARVALRSWEGRIGLVLGTLVLLIVALGPGLAPYDANETSGMIAAGPSSAHPLGTDGLGRDVLSRTLDGGRSIIVPAVAALIIGFALGALIGVSASYIGGWYDAVVIRVLDMFYALPELIIVLVVVVAVGASPGVIALAAGGLLVPGVARATRLIAKGVITEQYVLAAQLRGERTLAIVRRELLPNMAGPMLADLGLRVTLTINLVATVGFLGLTSDPSAPNWGQMIADSRAILAENPLAALAPALAIVNLSVGFNFLSTAYGAAIRRDRGQGRIQL